jgi:hypothetical protein
VVAGVLVPHHARRMTEKRAILMRCFFMVGKINNKILIYFFAGLVNILYNHITIYAPMNPSTNHQRIQISAPTNV